MRPDLSSWMADQKLSDRQVAEALGFDPSYVWYVRNGKRPVSDAFRWRFAEKYGYKAAYDLFDKEKEAAR